MKHHSSLHISTIYINVLLKAIPSKVNYMYDALSLLYTIINESALIIQITYVYIDKFSEWLLNNING